MVKIASDKVTLKKSRIKGCTTKLPFFLKGYK